MEKQQKVFGNKCVTEVCYPCRCITQHAEQQLVTTHLISICANGKRHNCLSRHIYVPQCSRSFQTKAFSSTTASHVLSVVFLSMQAFFLRLLLDPSLRCCRSNQSLLGHKLPSCSKTNHCSTLQLQCFQQRGSMSFEFPDSSPA